MTLVIRGRVRKARRIANVWVASAFTIDGDHPNHPEQNTRVSVAYSHPEAVQLSLYLMKELDESLMNELHAERTSRRTEKSLSL